MAEPYDYGSGALCDLVMSGMKLYPMVVGAGLAYWSELAGTAASCYGDAVEALVMALRDPLDRDAAAAKLATSARRYLLRTGDISEMAILDLHGRLKSRMVRPGAVSPLGTSETGGERIVGALRSVADAALNEAWKFESPEARPDLEGVRRSLERALEELRRAQSEGSTPASPS